ncbi:hypothetical protein [Pararobbsia silviterrae]|nr:hypothetical protein [Pararobbsia silviterrae]
MQIKKIAFCLGVCALLAACGGDGSTAATPGQSVAQTQPLPSGSTYIATASFGDTIKVQLDAPSAGDVTITFVNSQFGLSGSITSPYSTSSSGRYSAYDFTASGAPDVLTNGASGIVFVFNIAADGTGNGTLNGTFGDVPNVKAGSGTLTGQVTGSNNGVTTVAGLAGTYSFIKLSGDYTSAGTATGDQDADTGQIKINADGTFRACPSAAYSDTCMDDEDPSLADTGTIAVDADQTDYPGAFDLTLNGLMYGRLFASTANGAITLMLDQAGTNSDGTYRTGSWVLQSASTLVSGTDDGEFYCEEPTLGNDDVATGDISSVYTTISGTTLGFISDSTLAFNTSFSAVNSSSTPTPVAINGLMSTTYTNTNQTQSAMMLLPISSNAIAYLDEPAGDGFFVQGLCLRTVAPPPPP